MNAVSFPKQDIDESPSIHPMIRPGRILGNAPYAKSPTARKERNTHTRRGKLTTSGSILHKAQAFVYVGVKRTGPIKIGMSSNPLARCKRLGIDLGFTVPVVVSSAKLVETYALQSLGALIGDSEWVHCSFDEAVDAVAVAWMAAGKIQHVNPAITADEARQLRVRMAA